MDIESFIRNLFEDCNRDINVLRSKLFKYEIKTIFEKNKDKKNRIILYSDKYPNIFNDYKNIDTSLFNGIILEVETWKVICIPQNKFRHINYSITSHQRLRTNSAKQLQEISMNIENNLYMIYKLNDGTTINLYWWNDNDGNSGDEEKKHENGKWVISTARGMEMNDIVWVGNISYANILHELLTQYPKFSWNKLDKNKIYTIGFNHFKYHPFRPDTNSGRMWFIQSINKSSNFEVNDKEDIGLPLQEIWIDDVTKSSLEQLGVLCDHSLSQYIKYNQVNFGFMLVSNDKSKTKHNSYIMMESSLFQKIRYYMYSKKYNKIINENEYQRIPFIVLRSYLDINVNTENSEFIRLFPQFESIFNEYDKIIIRITNILAKCLMDESEMNKLSSDKYTLLIRRLFKYIFKFFPSSNDTRRTFKDRKSVKLEIIKYIIDDHLIYYYYPVLGKQGEEMLK